MPSVFRALLIFGMCCYANIAFAAHINSGLALLKVETGARASAMGEAFTAVSADPLSQNYNPAGAAGGSEFNAYLGQTLYWENITLQSGFTSFAKGSWQFHFSVRSAKVDGIEARGSTPSINPDFVFDSRDLSVKAGVAIPLNERLTVGLALGWVMERISFYQSSTMMFDIGAVYKQNDKLTLGFSVLNIGSALSFDSADVSLPTAVRGGASYVLNDVLLAADGVFIDEEFHLHFGAEYQGIKALALRAGYQSGYDSKSVTFGVGFSKNNLRFDYTFIPYSNSLTDSHQFGLSVFVN
ncbi:PorV/PorQ family protein [Gemmatimonas aurantiaca]|nr:PorV/PorQ family protein [Gemmatimonas aurantiaca]